MMMIDENDDDDDVFQSFQARQARLARQSLYQKFDPLIKEKTPVKQGVFQLSILISLNYFCNRGIFP